jgi:hypothetical protein
MKEFDFTWSLPPEQWLCRQTRKREGLPLTILPGRGAVWAEPHTPANEQEPGSRRYRLTWKLIMKEPIPGLKGPIQLAPVELQAPDESVLGKSNLLNLDVRVVPLPRKDRPSLNLGVGDYRLEASIQPTVITLGETTVLTLKLSGEGALAALPRPELTGLQEFDRPDDFLIEDDTETWAADGSARYFRYRIRPRHAAVDAIPKIFYTFFHPHQQDHPVRATDALPLTVRPPLAVQARQRPYADGPVPDRLRLDPAGPDLLRREQLWPRSGVLWLLFVLPPVLWGCVLLVKIRSFRAAWRAKGPRLSAAAARALAALDAKHATYDGEHVTRVLITYMRQRFKLVPVEPTPAEVEQCLLAHAVAPAQRTAVAELLHECAAARFSPPASWPVRNFREWAEQVIRALDVAP